MRAGCRFCGKVKGGVPVFGYDGITVDVYAFGFGSLADAGEGGFVLFLLERACHAGGCMYNFEIFDHARPKIPTTVF